MHFSGFALFGEEPFVEFWVGVELGPDEVAFVGDDADFGVAAGGLDGLDHLPVVFGAAAEILRAVDGPAGDGLGLLRAFGVVRGGGGGGDGGEAIGGFRGGGAGGFGA